MFDIVAGQDGGFDMPAADLPEAEPSAADLEVIDLEELHELDLTQERMDAALVELAFYGAVDEVASRRHRRQVRAQLAQVASATAQGVVSA